jgi:hypothetical protein
MVIWLGIMRLAERSGMVQIIARVLQPSCDGSFQKFLRNTRHGRDGDEHGCQHAGLGNAATPLGLRAMSLLDQLNPRRGVADERDGDVLVINTASIQLIPTTAIGILAISGSRDPTAFVPPRSSRRSSDCLAESRWLSCSSGFRCSRSSQLTRRRSPPLGEKAMAPEATIGVETVTTEPLTPCASQCSLRFSLPFSRSLW